jgi:hypothetical protein
MKEEKAAFTPNIRPPQIVEYGHYQHTVFVAPVFVDALPNACAIDWRAVGGALWNRTQLDRVHVDCYPGTDNCDSGLLDTLYQDNDYRLLSFWVQHNSIALVWRL